jgi:hypothetical protein
MSTKQKVIILLEPDSINSKGFNEELIEYCRDNFAVIKIVKLKNKYDFKSMRRVARSATSWHGKITIIISKETILSPTNMFTCSVVGVLSVARIADICIYQKLYTENGKYHGINIKPVPYKIDPLYMTTKHFTKILDYINERKLMKKYLDQLLVFNTKM